MPDANANPEKRFFIDLIIKDISLEDAILDLIDNAVDSLILTKEIDIYKDFVNREKTTQNEKLAKISINFSNRQFSIQDNCGGITFEHAKNDVFRFGHPDPHRRVSLSVFGIGMKRAIFKIGRYVRVESKAAESGFSMRLDVDKWLSDVATNWQIPIEKEGEERDPLKTGTRIIITRLREEVSTLTENPAFQNKLIKTIQESYPFFLGRHVRVFVNEKEVNSEDISFAESENIKPTIETWKDGNVKATLICGLLPREDAQWTFDKSGWYLVCNGRVIVNADKTKLTGWGLLLPQFMPKHRGFLGIVFFRSNYPEELPWNTTKRGIDTESGVYIRAVKKMNAASKPVLQLQNKMYESNDTDEPKERYRDSVKDLPASSATLQAAESGITNGASRAQVFSFAARINQPKITTIQFWVKEDDIVRVKRKLGRVSMSNREVGDKIFKYFMDRECIE